MKLCNQILFPVMFISLMGFFGCQDDSKSPVEPSLNLSKGALTFDSSGGTDTLDLSANGHWEITEFPDWIEVSPTSGEGDATLLITIDPNNSSANREISLTINRDDLAASVLIMQEEKGLSYLLPAVNAELLKDSLWSDREGHSYFFETRELFINPAIRSQIFPGQLIDVTTNTRLNEVKGYTYNPLTLSTPYHPIGDKFEMSTPSAQQFNLIVAQVTANKDVIKKSDSFVYRDQGAVYQSYKDLRTMGVIALGVNLDSLINGVSYKEKEMTKRNGIVYDYMQVYFDLMLLDYPLPEHVVKEPLTAEDLSKDNLAHIGMIQFGRCGFLFVETDSNKKDITPIISKIKQGTALTAEEQKIINDSNVCYLTMNPDGQWRKETGKTEVIQQFYNELFSTTPPVYPIAFNVFSPVNYNPDVTLRIDIP